MADQQQVTPSQSTSPSPSQSQQQKDDMLACVAALEAALLPCLPARELQAVDRSVHSSHQIDVERHARDFMEAAKKIQLYFIGLQHGDQPTKEEMLRKEISTMEEELKAKSELIDKHEKLIEGWKKELKDQLDKHVAELEREERLALPSLEVSALVAIRPELTQSSAYITFMFYCTSSR